MLKFDNMRDKLNFKMYCSYCHQVGTVGSRTPEEPVDWETMIRRMNGFGSPVPPYQAYHRKAYHGHLRGCRRPVAEVCSATSAHWCRHQGQDYLVGDGQAIRVAVP